MSNDSLSSIDSPRKLEDTSRMMAVGGAIPQHLPAADNNTRSNSDQGSISQRDELLEVGRTDIAAKLAAREIQESQREAELLRLESLNRKLVASSQVLEKEVAHWKGGFNEAREQAELHLKTEVHRWQTQLSDVEKAKEDANRRYQSAQDEISNLRSQLIDVRARNDELIGKTRILERLVEDYKLETQKSKSRLDEDAYIQNLRNQLSDKDCTIADWKERCSRTEAELQQARSNVLVLNSQAQLLEEEKSSYERQLIEWEAKRKSGGIVDASTLANQKNDLEQLKEELSMVYVTNTRLIAIMKNGTDVSQFIRSLPEDPTGFFYCGPTQAETPSPMLMMLSGEKELSAAVHPKHDSLKLSLEAHNLSGRSRHLAARPGHEAHVASAASGAPIYQQREKDYWIPKEAFVKASEFRDTHLLGSSSACDGVDRDVFYNFLVELNRVWYERMRNRNYIAAGGAAAAQAAKKEVTQRASSSATGRGVERSTSAKRRKSSVDRNPVSSLQAQLITVRREAAIVGSRHVSVQKILGAYDRICEVALQEKTQSDNAVKKLRDDIQSMLSSRDPHIIELKNTMWKLVSDSQRCGTRLTTQVGHLLSEYERTVDLMQLADSFRAFFTSFSQTVREVLNTEVDTLKQCATEASSHYDEVCHYQPVAVAATSKPPPQSTISVITKGNHAGQPKRRISTAADPTAEDPAAFRPSQYF